LHFFAVARIVSLQNGQGFVAAWDGDCCSISNNDSSEGGCNGRVVNGCSDGDDRVADEACLVDEGRAADGEIFGDGEERFIVTDGGTI